MIKLRWGWLYVPKESGDCFLGRHIHTGKCGLYQQSGDRYAPVVGDFTDFGRTAARNIVATSDKRYALAGSGDLAQFEQEIRTMPVDGVVRGMTISFLRGEPIADKYADAVRTVLDGFGLLYDVTTV